MLDNKGFNLWADGYDESVNLSEESNEYPFAGYKKVLDNIYKTICTKSKAKILDVGFGTAILSHKLYKQGYEIWGIDFSDKMIDIAKEKMPNTNLINFDFSKGLPYEIENEQFDFIICNYAIHHLDDNQKVILIKKLFDILKEDGKILVGDVAFANRKQHDKCRHESADLWDEEEIYLVYDEIKMRFEESKTEFRKISFCSAVITLTK